MSASAAVVDTPTGSEVFGEGEAMNTSATYEITIPNGIKVIYASLACTFGSITNTWSSYVGVTPGKTYTIFAAGMVNSQNGTILASAGNESNSIIWINVFDSSFTPQFARPFAQKVLTLSWSPTINKHAVDVTDY